MPDGKPIPVLTGENDRPTQPASNSLVTMLGKGVDIDHCPKCGEYLHDEMGHVCPDVPKTSAIVPKLKTVGAKQPTTSFQIGEKVRDVRNDCLVTILKLNVASSPAGTPYHKVVNSRTGEVYAQPETKLKKR